MAFSSTYYTHAHCTSTLPLTRLEAIHVLSKPVPIASASLSYSNVGKVGEAASTLSQIHKVPHTHETVARVFPSIPFPQLWLLRGLQACTGLDLPSMCLDRVQLGLEMKPKWHHITYTRSKEGKPCYRVRVCKTCAQQRRIELGTYCDLESALLVNDVYELSQGRTKLLNVLCEHDLAFSTLFRTRKLDRGKVLIYTLEQTFRQMSVSLSTGTPKSAMRSPTRSVSSDLSSSSTYSLVKRKRSGSDYSGSELGTPVPGAVSSFELDARNVLSKVLLTHEAGTLLSRHCEGKFAIGSFEDAQRAILAQLIEERDTGHCEVIHPYIASITFRMLLHGRTDIPPDHVERILSLWYKKAQISTKRSSSVNSLLLEAGEQRSVWDGMDESMRHLMSYIQLPKARIVREVSALNFLDRASSVLKDFYVRTYNMCSYLRMPVSAPTDVFLDERLEGSLHVCERKIRTLSKVCAAMAVVEESHSTSFPSSNATSCTSKFVDLRAQIAECVVWYCLLHVSISLRLQDCEGSAHIEMLDDCLNFLAKVQSDPSINATRFHASHQVMVIGSQILVACTKIRTLRFLAPEQPQDVEVEEEESVTTQTCKSVGLLLNRMASLGLMIGYVPISNFAMMSQLLDAGMPGTNGFKNLCVFEAGLIFDAACLEALFRLSDSNHVPEFVRTQTDMNPPTLIQNLCIVLQRIKRICEETKFACLLAESLLCLKIVVEIMCSPWAAEQTSASGELSSLYPTSAWAGGLVRPDDMHRPLPSPYDCVAGVAPEDPLLPLQLKVALLAVDLLRLNAQRYRLASRMLYNLGAPMFPVESDHSDSYDISSSEADDPAQAAKRATLGRSEVLQERYSFLDKPQPMSSDHGEQWLLGEADGLAPGAPIGVFKEELPEFEEQMDMNDVDLLDLEQALQDFCDEPMS